MADYREAFVGIDVAKLKNAISIAEAGRTGEIRYVGELEASDASMRRVIQRIVAKFDRVHFCYEAGPTVMASTGSSSLLAMSAWLSLRQ